MTEPFDVKKARELAARLRVIVIIDEVGSDNLLGLTASDALLSALDVIEKQRLVLNKHHAWHLTSGTIGLPDHEGGWIEMDNASEYADSSLCEETLAALALTQETDDAG